VSTKAKKPKSPAPYTAPPDWWKTDISNPEVLRREFGAVEKMFDTLHSIRLKEEEKAKDAEIANLELEDLALEIERQVEAVLFVRELDERKRRYGDWFPMVYERLVTNPVSENKLPRRLGRPKGSKNKPK
jgi:hypothetical protein